MMSFPKKKWSEQKPVGIKMPEEALQVFVDDYLTNFRIVYFRIQDGFFRWIKMNAPMGIQKWFFGMFGGWPDNTLFLPIDDKYSLAVSLELKTATGKLHGKQKTNSKKIPWQIARTPEEAMVIIERAKKDVEKIKLMMGEQKI